MTAAFTPGTYIAARRVAAHLSIEDVAARIATDPHMAERDRVAWLSLIEADDAPISADTVNSLRAVFPFDIEVLERLADLHWCQAKLPAPRLCRVCACSEQDACIHPAGMGCALVAEDLCTACVPVRVRVPTSPSNGAVA